MQINDWEGKRRQAYELARQHGGHSIVFYHPGMFRINGHYGKYPAISITGKKCELLCEHCRNRLLAYMIPASCPEELVSRCLKLEASGNRGILLSGGCRSDGSLPWEPFVSAIHRITHETKLILSIHSGFLNLETAQKLKNAGIHCALVDMVGDDETFDMVYHLANGCHRLLSTLNALVMAGITIVPHIITGIHFGQMKGEYHALRMLKPYNPSLLVIATLMPLANTGMKDHSTPSLSEISHFITQARLEFPTATISLGCARPRPFVDLEHAAIDCGVNRMALPDESTIRYARQLGLAVEFQNTCCCIPCFIP